MRGADFCVFANDLIRYAAKYDLRGVWNRSRIAASESEQAKEHSNKPIAPDNPDEHFRTMLQMRSVSIIVPERIRMP